MVWTSPSPKYNRRVTSHVEESHVKVARLISTDLTANGCQGEETNTDPRNDCALKKSAIQEIESG